MIPMLTSNNKDWPIWLSHYNVSEWSDKCTM